MSDHNQLIVYTFDGEARAEDARRSIQAMDARHDSIRLGNLAVVSRHADGRLEFWETAEADEVRRDANILSVVGWLLGAVGAILGAPLGPRQGADAGAGVGTEAAERADLGFQDEDLRRVGEQLVAGSSALIVLVREGDVATVVGELEQLGGTLAQSSLPPETLVRLRAEK
ncbi:MAG: hypothetical protein RLZZ387_4235 [Chloroflexota bacterium]|jgi:uncharacterized membrane protein